MENFKIYNPTELHFGNNVLDKLSGSLQKYGKKVLFVHGTGSIRKTGLYNRIHAILRESGMEVFEYGGIRSNPVVSDVDAAAELGRKHQVDMILAVGGGSVIDSAKIIAITIPANHPAWDFYTKKEKPVSAVPLLSVLTLAATGTEMNQYAVLQNEKTGQKWGFGNPLLYPRQSFLDPALTITVPKDYTAYGIADLVAHCLELYFGAGDASLSDRISASIIREAMEYGPQLLDNLEDYDLRARIMYAATQALNGLTGYGKVSGDWAVHGMGHVLSFLYQIPHGASLTIVYPAWLNHVKCTLEDRIAALGTELFREPLDADETIAKITEFFRSIGCPVSLADVGIGADQFDTIVSSLIVNEVDGGNVKLGVEDYRALVKEMLDARY